MKSLITLLLLVLGCEGRMETYAGTITKIKSGKSFTAVTLDTLASAPKPLGAMGHGEVWLTDVDLKYISTLIGKRVVITGVCDGWVCKQVKITEESEL